MTRTKPDPALLAEVAAFLYYEVRLLDEGRYTEWLDLLADDIRYYGPTRELVQGDPKTPRTSPEGLSFDLYNDDKPSLKMRVDRVLTGLAHSDLPHSVTQHLISNVEIEPAELQDELVARSKFIVLQVRPGRHEGHESTFFGDRTDVLRRHGDSWQICRRHINLAHSVLPRAVSILF